MVPPNGIISAVSSLGPSLRQALNDREIETQQAGPLLNHFVRGTKRVFPFTVFLKSLELTKPGPSMTIHAGLVNADQTRTTSSY